MIAVVNRIEIEIEIEIEMDIEIEIEIDPSPPCVLLLITEGRDSTTASISHVIVHVVLRLLQSLTSWRVSWSLRSRQDRIWSNHFVGLRPLGRRPLSCRLASTAQDCDPPFK